ncbi:MAG: shikimate kinase [Bacteroidota bacterium]
MEPVDHIAPPVHERNERIFLAGFMGSGKSTIGPILANTLGFEFLDIDRSIEEEQGKSVTAIFRENGEQYFRALEQAALQRVKESKGIVVALGGGTLTNADNLRTVCTSGILVYLKISEDQLFRRLRHRGDRPMLAGADGAPLDDEQLRQRIGSLFRAREPMYAMADITLQTDETRLGVTIDHLVQKLKPLLR